MLTVLLLIPAFILVAFSIKVKNGDFSIELTEWEQEARKVKPIANANFIKLKTPGSSKLECTIHYSDSVYYRKFGSGKDSLSVEKSGDTLCFNVITRHETKEGEERSEIFVDIFMPFKGLLMLDGAAATLDSVAADAEISVEMINKSSLNLGNPRPENRKNIRMAALQVNGDASAVYLFDNTQIDKLSLNMGGNSNLFFGKDLAIGSLNGMVSAATEVNGAAKWIYQLKPLP
ncbi:MAG: hypothetical protein A1D16_10210 [Flavihumibacter sp. CACIAM 22H1]|nr:MAG: hypothetical protein A1D16_10210 [Flavihumibacter sp. CACIAM 22H1]